MREIQMQKPLSEQVYDALVDAICDGSLAPGERLTQDEVAERLKVSRLPVGQALARLKTDGFVCDAGRRGVMVAPLAPNFVRELFEFCSGVDQMAAGLAAKRADASARGVGDTVLATARTALNQGDQHALVRATLDFHRFIYRLANNTFICGVMFTHWNHVRRVLMLLGQRRDHEQVWREHAAILDAICAGDAETAERRMREHTERAAVYLIDAAKTGRAT